MQSKWVFDLCRQIYNECIIYSNYDNEKSFKVGRAILKSWYHPIRAHVKTISWHINILDLQSSRVILFSDLGIKARDI